MALPNNPGRGQIFNEFGNNTASDENFATDQSLHKMYNYIFGSGTNYSRDAFGGHGRPELSSISAVNIQSEQFDAQFTIDVNNTYGDVYVEYHEDDGNTPFSGQSTTTTIGTTYNSDGTKTKTVDLLDPDTLYRYRLQYNNKFTLNPNDWEVTGYFSVTTDPGTLDSPVLESFNSGDWDSGNQLLYTEWSTPTGTEPTSYTIECRVNFDTFQNAFQVFNTTNWNTTTDPKSADVRPRSTALSSGDFLEVRVIATRSGYTSATSNTETLTIP